MTMIARLIGRAEPAGWSWLVRRYCGGRSLVVACCCPKEYPDVLSPFVQRDRHFAGYEISEPALKGRYFLVLGAGLARRHGNKAACQRISERLNLFICRLGGRSMSEAILRIKYWGNNLGVRLPAAVARQAKLRAEQSVHVTVEGGAGCHHADCARYPCARRAARPVRPRASWGRGDGVAAYGRGTLVAGDGEVSNLDT